MFEIGAKLGDGWESDNRKQRQKSRSQRLLSPQAHRLGIRKERRRGKWVTLCGPFYLTHETKRSLLKALKKELGCGGTWKEETLELQGNQQRSLPPALADRGFGIRR